MHRSLILTEMMTSTFSNDKYQQVKDKNGKKQLLARFGIGVIEFFTSTLFLSFGIIFEINVNNFIYTTEDGLWTIIAFISSRQFTAPWLRRLAQYTGRKGHQTFKYLICLATVFLFCGLLMPGDIFCYGVFGGIFTNLITIQLTEIATDYFGFHLTVIEANIQCGKAVSLFVMPHIILTLFQELSPDQATLIFAVILLHVIPTSLIISPPKRSVPVDPELSRYSALPALSLQMREMMDFTNQEFTSSLSYIDPPEDEYDIQGDAEEDNTNSDVQYCEVLDFEPPHLCPLNSHTVKDYYSKAGVAILPEILEETEDSLQDNNVIDSKRISRISAKLEELNKKQNDFEIINISDLVISKQNVEVSEPIRNIEYISNYQEGNKTFLTQFDSIKSSCCCSCLDNTKRYWKHKFRCCKDIVLIDVCGPLLTALKDSHFYPTLLSKVSVNLVTVMYIILVPYLALQKNADYTKRDGAFLLSYMGFSWCLFLVVLPIVVKFNKRQLSTMYVCGLTVCGGSFLFLLKPKLSNDFITLSCFIFGFGYSIISYAETFVYRNYIGIRKWEQIQGTLDTTFAMCLILVYYIIYIYKIDVITIFSLVAITVYGANAAMWAVLAIVSSLFVKRKSYTVSELDGSQSLQLD